MKKTAVEWLEEQFKLNLNFPLAPKYQGIIQQAKEMEKEQLCYFYIKGAEAEINNPYVTNIEFYNETIKNK